MAPLVCGLNLSYVCTHHFCFIGPIFARWPAGGNFSLAGKLPRPRAERRSAASVQFGGSNCAQEELYLRDSAKLDSPKLVQWTLFAIEPSPCSQLARSQLTRNLRHTFKQTGRTVCATTTQLFVESPNESLPLEHLALQLCRSLGGPAWKVN